MSSFEKQDRCPSNTFIDSTVVFKQAMHYSVR